MSVNNNVDQCKCMFCHKSYKRVKSLENHIRNYHQSLCVTNSSCPECNESLPNDKFLDIHMKKFHTFYECGKCGKFYKRKASLLTHEFNHSAESNFICDMPLCDKSFKSPKRLTEHKLLKHRMIRKFMCEECGYRTRIHCNLIVHKRIHTGEKPFCCEICGKQFSTQFQLKSHISSHIAKRTYECEVCGETFMKQSVLYHHRFLHNKEKKFLCNLCNKNFSQPSGFSQHMRRHKEQNDCLRSELQNLKYVSE